MNDIDTHTMATPNASLTKTGYTVSWITALFLLGVLVSALFFWGYESLDANEYPTWSKIFLACGLLNSLVVIVAAVIAFVDWWALHHEYKDSGALAHDDHHSHTPPAGMRV